MNDKDNMCNLRYPVFRLIGLAMIGVVLIGGFARNTQGQGDDFNTIIKISFYIVILPNGGIIIEERECRREMHRLIW